MRLPAASGLTPEGVELALATALERQVTPGDLHRLVAAARSAPRCWVVASANVCTAAARSVALAVAASGDVQVRPSRRDPVVAELLVRALDGDPAFAAAGGHVAVVESLEPSAGDVVHAYGSDATMRALAASLPDGVVLRGHGTGLGVAVVTAGDHLEHAAEAIASDVVIFDQRGCLSPRIVLVEGGPERARSLGERLAISLARWQQLVPRGPLDAATAAELARWTRIQEALGDVASGPGHVVAVLDEVGALGLGPAARAVLVVPAGDASSLRDLAPFVAALGRDGPRSPLARSLAALAPGARLAALGQMQHPPLDGPVDRRSAHFHARPGVD